ncbi:MAG: helix-turn-helix transcriptional regulator [Peptococcaceae bacterium]|nr:helix-turn-helix transcriptional regulator [Peptococcaceae bacterium]
MDYTFFKQVGNNIENILHEKNYTQQDLANELKISKQVMNKIISGAKAINVEEIKKIASALNVSVDALLHVEPTPVQTHHFSFMGQVQNEETKSKINKLKTVIEEILLLEDYANANGPVK